MFQWCAYISYKLAKGRIFLLTVLLMIFTEEKDPDLLRPVSFRSVYKPGNLTVFALEFKDKSIIVVSPVDGPNDEV